jgi:tricorn protease
MVAELGCSHAWVSQGDPGAHAASHCPARLGADVAWDAAEGGYRVTSLVTGDAWDGRRGGPLAKPGVGVSVGDIIVAIDRVPLTEHFSPAEALIRAAGTEILLSFRPGTASRMAALRLSKSRDDGSKEGAKKNGKDGKGGKASTKSGKGSAAAAAAKPAKVQHARIRPLADDADARYRDGVRAAAAAVHTLGGGAVGYVAVPDMERLGFAEFTRAFAAESRRGALVVDLRGNLGGHISELLLARLAARRLGFELPRWGRPEPYPSAAPAGPLVLLIDEGTGSDGEVAAWAFRKMGLGPLVGARTWGGVTGNDQYADLVDGSQLAVPQVGMVLGDSDETAAANAIENRGVAPDLAVPIAPQDYAAGRDPQLQAAVLEALRALAAAPPLALPPAARARADAAAAAALAAGERADWPFETWAPIGPDEDEDEEEEEEEEEELMPRGGRGAGAGARGARR